MARRATVRSTAPSGLTAASADPHFLYQNSVQDAQETIRIIDQVFRSRQSFMAMSLREDFCGTALLCAHWVQTDPDRTAVGIDLDEPTLDWGIAHNIEPIGDAAARVGLVCGDVLHASTEPAFDVIVAFNFSYWVFKKRAVLLSYFRRARMALEEGGLFLIDLHGGPDAQFRLEEPARMDGFDYIWEQETFDPITHHTVCHIHYEFPDGSRMDRAFTYDWRLWTLPELRDILKEAGFSAIDVWWDEHNGDDEYAICESTVNLEGWVAYIAAWK